MTSQQNRHRHADAPRRDHYAEITAQVIAALKAGTPPWRKPWDTAKAGGPMMPQNAIIGASYRGINCLILGMSPLAFISGDPRWATHKQALGRGWEVRKGSRGTTWLFYNRTEAEKPESESNGGDDRHFIPLLCTFTLFHASQMDGITPYAAPSLEEAPWREPEATATIVRNSGAVIRYGGERAFYSPLTDHIQLPPPSSFGSAAAFASVQQHEPSHWTGSNTRLKRDLIGSFGSANHAREELRTELSQVMICSEFDIEDCDFINGTAYPSHWLDKLKNDKRQIFHAAADAQRIADYLLAFHPDYAARTNHQCSDSSIGETERDNPQNFAVLLKRQPHHAPTTSPLRRAHAYAWTMDLCALRVPAILRLSDRDLRRAYCECRRLEDDRDRLRNHGC